MALLSTVPGSIFCCVWCGDSIWSCLPSDVTEDNPALRIPQEKVGKPLQCLQTLCDSWQLKTELKTCKNSELPIANFGHLECFNLHNFWVFWRKEPYLKQALYQKTWFCAFSQKCAHFHTFSWKWKHFPSNLHKMCTFSENVWKYVHFQKIRENAHIFERPSLLARVFFWLVHF